MCYTTRMMSRTQEQTAGDISKPQVAAVVLCSQVTISVEEAAVLLGLGRSTAYNAVRNGSLPAVKIEGRWLVPTAKLRKMLGLDDE